MTISGFETDGRLAARSAIEALRAGVPSSSAVRALGCDQPRIEKEFTHRLDSIANGGPAESLLIKGDFGSGKSHCLEYFRELALDRRFAVSRVYVNKETPLHDPLKLFQGATDDISLPSRTGPAFLEIANQLVFNSQPFREFERWANHATSALDARFPATLRLFERFSAEHEFRDHLIRFWGGGKLALAEVRSRLRQIGEPWVPGHLSQRELAIQRFRFASRLMRAAGYTGWLLLIDEVELVGTYSSRQRAKSYIEIARFNQMAAEPGVSMLPVLAITDDFSRAILEEKGDLEKIPNLMPEAAEMSAEGMRLLAETGFSLRRPDVNALDDTFAAIRNLYARAYAWKPSAEGPVRREQSTPLRAYIRRWITEWDIHRLYPEAKIDVETAEWRTDYSEQAAHDAEAEVTSDQSLIDSVLGDI